MEKEKGKDEKRRRSLSRRLRPEKDSELCQQPKFTLLEQRRELDMLQRLEKIRAEDAGSDRRLKR